MAGNSALAMALNVLEEVPTFLEEGSAVVALIHSAIANIRVMQQQGRDPTQAEWDAVHKQIDDLRGELDAPEGSTETLAPTAHFSDVFDPGHANPGGQFDAAHGDPAQAGAVQETALTTASSVGNPGSVPAHDMAAPNLDPTPPQEAAYMMDPTITKGTPPGAAEGAGTSVDQQTAARAEELGETTDQETAEGDTPTPLAQFGDEPTPLSQFYGDGKNPDPTNH